MGAVIRRMRLSFLALEQPVQSAIEQGPRITSRKLLEVAEPPAEVRMAWLASKASSMKPRIPMIRFRYGKEHAESSQQSSGSAPNQRTSSTNSSPREAVKLEEVPARYRRRQMEQDEINAINTGGVLKDAPPVGKPTQKPGA
ncbi:hypothetical protein RvY_08814 [Ramazzottius varieornatus]|uniref:28S ribosomal protein S36, mitochondrial n=1 Tax=Ramazzottius varieornatus TaxID=947166 RepID=A0A1D1V771_RAMVA|nr:hypothetical protein RvY_08814 [Ramazzottius varieornatus]